MISDQSLTTPTTRLAIIDCSPDRSSSTSITPTNAMISDRSLTTTTKTNSSDRSSSIKQTNVSRKRPSIVFDEISADVSAASSSKKTTNAMSQKTSRTTIMDYTSSDRSSSMKRRSSSSKPSVVVDETVAAGSSSSEQQIPKHHWWKHWSGTHVVRDEHFTKSGRAVWAGRIIFVLVLISVATILGILAYHFLTEDEYERAEKQFIYISERAQMEAKEGLLARRWAGVTMASIVGEMYPNKEQWPFVEWLGFERITTSMLNTSRGNDMGFVPFVDPPKLSEFEDFAKATYKKLGFPNNTGVSKEFGFGVWYKQNNVMPPVKYHDINATSLNFDSPYKVLAPIFRTDEGYHPVLLFNVHSQNFTGHAIDQLINCSHVREDRHRRSLLDDEIETNRNNTSTPSTPSMPPNRCGVITDIFENLKLGGLWSIANFLPIYPVQDPLTVVGYIPSIFIVHELLDNIFAKDISGIDAVFESDARSISYTIVEGKPIYVGEGQHYDRNFEIHKVTKQLIDPELYADGQEGVPKSFKFHLIPNKNFFVRTKGPLVASIAVVVGIVLTMLAFLFYDFFVRKEFHAKRELLQARRQFMRFVSHEVRTPLNAVSMGLDLIQSEMASTLGYNCTTSYRASEDGLPHPESGLKRKEHDNIPPQKTRDWFQLTQEIQVNAQGAVDILNDLLNYDKIEQGKLNLGLEVVPVWHLLEKAIIEFKSPASSKNVKLSLMFGEDGKSQTSVCRSQDLPHNIRSLQVIGDSVRLTQVIRNLMSNALKFTRSEGSVHAKVLFCSRLTSQTKDKVITLQNKQAISGAKVGYIKVIVSDTGAGMTTDQLGRLFQDGVQFNVNELQKGGGSGLGLYIAKGIVKQHNGSLSATSDGIDKGTTFELNLPLWKLSSGGISDEEEEVKSDLLLSECTEENLAPKSLPLMKILVVDDVMSNRKLLIRLLERCGHHCDEAQNGKQCVEMVSQESSSGHPYDSILLDFEMPIMDGPTAAKSIRELGLKVNIIGITGNVLPDDIKFFKACGANDVLAKPVKMVDLNMSWVKFFSTRQEELPEFCGSSWTNCDIDV